MTTRIAPQPGKQMMFLSSRADIAFFGGARGGSKSYSILLEPLRHQGNGAFRTAFFRRTTKDLLNAGGLWDTANQIYRHVPGSRKRATPNLDWTFASGAQFQFHHLEHENDVENHRGAQYALICLDELPQFSAKQFWFLTSCNRSTSGVRPYMRCTGNPGPGWVKDLILWWLDDEGRFAREDRAGIIRYFVRAEDGTLIWGDTIDEVREQAPERFEGPDKPENVVTSFTFIPAKLDDNQILTQADPHYRSKLANMPLVERKRFLEGDWAITESAGTVFREEWYEIVDGPEPENARRVRYWDLAGSKKKRSDLTAGVKAAKTHDPTDKELVFVTIEDVVNRKESAGSVKALIARTARDDGKKVEVWIEEEKGAAGQIVIADIAKMLPGYTVRPSPVGNQDKLVRSKPVSSFAELTHRSGRPGMRLVRAPWNAAYKQQHQAFPDGRAIGLHDDIVDSSNGAWHALQIPEFAWASATWGGEE